MPRLGFFFFFSKVKYLPTIATKYPAVIWAGLIKEQRHRDEWVHKQPNPDTRLIPGEQSFLKPDWRFSKLIS